MVWACWCLDAPPPGLLPPDDASQEEEFLPLLPVNDDDGE